MLKINKKPYLYNTRHFRDNFTDLGYDYHGHIFEKSLSKQVFANPKTKLMILASQCLIEFLIDECKKIKLHYSIAHDKDSIKIN